MASQSSQRGWRRAPTSAACCRKAVSRRGRRARLRRPAARHAGGRRVALAVVLTIQAGLLSRSFAALLETDPGFRADHLLTLQMNTSDHITAPEPRRAFYASWFERVRPCPGSKPWAAPRASRWAAGRHHLGASRARRRRPAALPEVEFRRGSPDYFRAMGMPIFAAAGSPAGHWPKTAVVVINETMARVVFGRRRVRTPIANRPHPTGPWMHRGRCRRRRTTQLARESAPARAVRQHAAQPAHAPFIAVRTSSDSAALVERAPRGVARARIGSCSTTSGRWRTACGVFGRAAVRLPLVGGFGVLALVLAAVGVYGVLALVVAERTPRWACAWRWGPAGAVVRLVLGQARAERDRHRPRTVPRRGGAAARGALVGVTAMTRDLRVGAGRSSQARRWPPGSGGTGDALMAMPCAPEPWRPIHVSHVRPLHSRPF